MMMRNNESKEETEDALLRKVRWLIVNSGRRRKYVETKFNLILTHVLLWEKFAPKSFHSSVLGSASDLNRLKSIRMAGERHCLSML